MKTKKMVAGLLLVLGIVGFCATNASAVEASYTCTINRIGGYAEPSGAMYVQLTPVNNAFTSRLFRIPDARMNQIMAVLLTAASNGATVWVRLDPDIANQANRYLKFAFYNVE